MMACLVQPRSICPTHRPSKSKRSNAVTGSADLSFRNSTQQQLQSLKLCEVGISSRGCGIKQPLRVNCCGSAVESTTATANSEKYVLVVGASGGVGQLVVANLLEKGFKVRGLLRNPEKASSLFGEKTGQFDYRTADCRQPKELNEEIFAGITHVICCTGTTAFPSARWDGNNGPEQTDWIGIRNLIDAIPKTVQKVVLVSSVGVTRFNSLPFNIMNLFGVLKYKKMGEDHLRKSGMKYTIIRPSRLTDGPYTSYDLNTLLQATSGTRRDVIIGQGDTMVGEASRIVVAEACVNALDLECTTGQTYEIGSIEGEGPGKDIRKWQQLFESAHSVSSSFSA